MQPMAALRLLLRAVDRNITSVAGNKQWREHVLEQFRANRHLEDASRQQQLVLLAKEYADLIQNIAHHQELLTTYNIGIDADERNKQMVAKTAARVGFSLPQSGQQPDRPLNQQQQQQQQPEEQQQQQHASQHPQQQQEETASQPSDVVAAASVVEQAQHVQTVSPQQQHRNMVQQQSQGQQQQHQEQVAL